MGVISHEMIDAVGICEANRLAMQEALQQVQKRQKNLIQKTSFLFIDGRDNYSFQLSDLPNPLYIVRGDSKVKQIMAASILAKVTRDKIMIHHASNFPNYGFEKHK